MASGSTARKKRRVLPDPESEDDDTHVEELGPPHLEESSKRRASSDGKHPARKVRIVYQANSRPGREDEDDDNDVEEICRSHQAESSVSRDTSGRNLQAQKSSAKVVNEPIPLMNWLILTHIRHHHRQNPPETRLKLHLLD